MKSRLTTDQLRQRAQEHRTASLQDPAYPRDPKAPVLQQKMKDAQETIAEVYEELIEYRTNQR